MINLTVLFATYYIYLRITTEGLTKLLLLYMAALLTTLLMFEFCITESELALVFYCKIKGDKQYFLALKYIFF
jgi:hypothetical protein